MSRWLSAVLVFACACSGSTETPPDAGLPITVDGGFTDAGRTDAGTLPSDAGTADAQTADAQTADAQTADAGEPDAGPPTPIRVLVFSRTRGFRHNSIPDGITALTEIAADEGWTLEATEDLARLTPAVFAEVDVFVGLNTTGDFLEANQESALQTWYRAGGGYVGVHSAADAEYDWPWYGELVGAWFERHPAIQEATLVVEDRNHPATMHLDANWTRRDEWYDFRRNPRPDVDVLISIDESTYNGGGMGADHPMTWARTFDGGRTFYTAFGHTAESYAEPSFRVMLREAIRWTSGQ